MDTAYWEFAEPIDAAEETDDWEKFAQAFEEIHASLTIPMEELAEKFRQLLYLGVPGFAWKREPWVPPERPEKLRGLWQYGPARVVMEPPGGVLYLKCSRRFKKGARSEPT